MATVTGTNFNDHLEGTDDEDTLRGFGGNDVLIGRSSADFLYGGAGHDYLDGGEGIDVLHGGSGNDTYVVDTSGDRVVEEFDGGIDTIRSSATYMLRDNVENLVLTGDAAITGIGNGLDNFIVGNSAANILSGGAGNDRLDGGGGVDDMRGGAGDDVYVVGGGAVPDSVFEAANEGIDTVRSSLDYVLPNHVEHLILTGVDALRGTGNALANTIIGNSGDNWLDGGLGADIMRGGLGDDTYVVQDALDAVTEYESEGIDRVISSRTYTLGAHLENLVLSGGAAINGTGNVLDNTLTGNTAANILRGGLGNDTYVIDGLDTVIENAGQGVDTVKTTASHTLGAHLEHLVLLGFADIDGTGNDLDNVLTGNAADNVLDGKGGANQLFGGGGDDTFVVRGAGDTVVETAGQGTDLVLSAVSYYLPNHVENLVLTGNAAIEAHGNALDNVLIGNAADNLLDGRGGADTLKGGLGNDTYRVDHAGDVVVENSGEGTDTVRSVVSHTLAANVENLTLTGTSAINGTGNALDNLIIGNAGANILHGGQGDDRLDGGGGVDSMRGGAGNDVYVVNEGDFTHAATRLTLEGSASYLLQTPFSVTGGDGSFFTQAADQDGDGLADAIGLIYNDYDGVPETRANLSLSTWRVGANLEPGVYLDAQRAAFAAPGHPGLDLSVGSRGSNQVFGNFTITESLFDYGGPTPTVLRFASSFELYSESPSATPIYGTFNYNASAGGVVPETVVELANEGIDTVRSAIDYALPNHAENLILTGHGSIRGAGNALPNIIVGNGGANCIDGGLGADAMRGGGGDDTYVVQDALDQVIEYAGEGFDRVLSSRTYTLGANLENLILTGGAAINGTGNELDNGLTGNSGANVLRGGLGNDTYVVDALDTVIEHSNEGTDTVKAFASYTLGAHVENLVLLGSADLNGTGNELYNVLTGNAGDNVLDGGAGPDWMVGGAGDDTFIVDGGDIVWENTDGGTDHVLSSVGYYLWGEVENLTLTGNDAISGVGNDLANVLTGNAAANILDGGLGIDRLVGGDGDDIYIVDGAPGAPTARLSLFGEPGAWVVQGSLDFTQADGTFRVYADDRNADGGADVLHLTYVDNVGYSGNWFYLDVSTTQLGVNLAPGHYADAQRMAFAQPGHPGLDFSGNGMGNNEVFGNLTIQSAAFDYSSGVPLVLDFAIDFEQHGESPTAPGVFGRFTYTAALETDVVVEQANQGIDTVRSALSYVLPDHVENLELTGYGPSSGGGNALDNVITGNAGANRFTGGAGSDTFNYDMLDIYADAITDFETGVGGDRLDLRDLLPGYAIHPGNVSAYVRLTGSASHVDVAIDTDGVGGDFVTLARLENVAMSASLLDNLLADGNLLVA